MHWDRIETFVAVVQHGGFSAAARALGKTQSAVSQAVALLERDLGQTLFARRRRGAAVTDAGRILLEHAERARGELARATARLAALGPLEEGRLVLATSDTLGYYYLPAALSAFRERHPRVELQLRTSPSPNTLALVAAGDVDLGVASLPLPERPSLRRGPGQQPVRIEALSHQKDVLIVPPSHALAARAHVGWREAADLHLLLLGQETAGRQVVDRAFTERGLAPSVVMEMNSVELLKRMVELGFGAAIVPAMAVGREVATRQLAALELIDEGRTGTPTPTRQVGLILPGEDATTHAAEVFASVLRATARGESGSGPHRPDSGPTSALRHR